MSGTSYSLMSNSRYGTDTTRRSWCFLSLDIASTHTGQHIETCEIAEGNQEQFLDSKTLSARSPDEEASMLKTLSKCLDEYRYDGTTLITMTEHTLRMLRTRLLVHDHVEQPTFRGFNHLALASILDTYFERGWMEQFPTVSEHQDVNQIDACNGENGLNEETISTTDLWNIRTEIGPLVPQEVLQGTPL